MDLQLVNGRFSVNEAELLLNELAQTKIQHHMRRIARSDHAEEDIKALEKRIREIESDLRDTVRQMKANANSTGMVDVEGTIVVRPVR